MKPQPMSDAAMRRILQKTAESIDAPNIVMTHWLIVARAIRDARDAQWAAMIGEPVAWALAGSGHSSMQGPALWLRAPTADEQAMWASFGHPATVSPLYAIKEPTK